jgi:hypothetical protein
MDNVVFIIEENKNYTEVTSTYASACPYINALRTTGTWAAGKTTNFASAINYKATAFSPSAPNYLALTSGRLLQNGSDGWNSYSYQNIVDLMVNAGVSWGAYMEDLPTNWEAQHGAVGLYATKHNPFNYYSDIFGDPTRTPHVKDYTAFVPGAERFQWITPNLTDDGHTDPGGATGSAGKIAELGYTNSFLETLIPTIMNSAAFAPGKKAVIIITWDGGDVANEPVPCLILGPGAKTIQSSVAYTHFSLLKTWESMLGLGSLGQNDAGASVMSDMIGGGGSSSDTPVWINKSFSTETFSPNSSTQGANFNESLAFGALSSETFAPSVSGGSQIIHPAIACGTASLPSTTLL